jgi:hypothetical protein
MKAIVWFAAAGAAIPSSPSGPTEIKGVGNGRNIEDDTHVRFPVPDDITVKQATDKCGDQAQLSCCNKATYAGDTTDIDEGVLAGTLKILLGVVGPGSEGFGLFEQCSKLDIPGLSLFYSRYNSK